MKISKSKQELARIISENGGWRDEAEWAAQCKSDVTVSFYSGCAPYRDGDCWWGDHLDGTEIKILKLMPNWHQTILSREEYFHLYPASDADGWIEHDGKHEPAIAKSGRTLWCKWSDGIEQSHEASMVDWVDDSEIRVVAYRLHKPEQAKPEFCESVIRSIPEPSNKPTIEQLAADYRNLKDYADRKQQEADAAKADAEAKLAELVAAGKALGLVLSVADTVLSVADQEPELVITDWRDLLPGDKIECVDGSWASWAIGRIAVVREVESADYAGCMPIMVEVSGESDWGDNFKFIRRP